jgi:DNA ligase-1
MLCQTGDLPDLKRLGYVSEPKYDGTRVLVIKEKGEVSLQNRHGVDYTGRLPEIVKAAKGVQGDFTVDGEAVYIDPQTGEEEFTPSQIRCSTHIPDYMLRQQYPITLKGFDLIKLNDEDLTDKPFWRRKELLKELLHSDVIQYVPYTEDLQNAWIEVLKQEREGLVIKDKNSRYTLNDRSWSWLKVKNWRSEECNVAGYTQGLNSRSHFFGSLVLIGKDGKFRGCVGSGFNDWELRKTKDVLLDSPKTEPPFPYSAVGEHYVAVKTDEGSCEVL